MKFSVAVILLISCCDRMSFVRISCSVSFQQLVKEMRPLNSCHLLFKLAVEQDMVMNVLAAGMEILTPDLPPGGEK